MMSGIVSINGVVSPLENAKISVLDRGFLYGDSVFEVFVGFQNQILDTEAHLERLRHSAEELRMTIPWSNDELRAELLQLTAQYPAPKKNIRLIVSRGEGMGISASASLKPNKVIFILPAKTETLATYKDGLKLKSKSLNFTERGPAAKTSNYLKSIIALEVLSRDKVDDVLWVNSSGEITEASTANIFFLGRQGDLLEVATPHIQSGILPGITRAKLIALLNMARIPVTERVIYADELPRFDEAFLCSTVRGLVPVTLIDQHRLHTTRPSCIFKEIERLYFASVERDLGYRVEWNSGAVVPKIDQSYPN